MATRRATGKCPVCKRPCTTSIHPSCQKRRAGHRVALATNPKRELKRRARRKRKEVAVSAVVGAERVAGRGRAKLRGVFGAREIGNQRLEWGPKGR